MDIVGLPSTTLINGIMMELTPHCAKSPKSPFRFPDSNPIYDYPSPARSDTRYRSTDSIHGLGLFTVAMAESTVENNGLGAQDHSSISTNSTWPPLQHRNPPASSSSTPNILSAEYDPFAPSHSLVFPSFTHDIYSSLPAEVVGPLVLSGNTSQRSSISSTHSSEIFTQAGSIHSYTPNIKTEEPTDFCTGSDTLVLNPPAHGHGHLVTSANSYPGSLAATYYNQAAMGWAKIEYSNNQELPSLSSLAIPRHDKTSESLESLERDSISTLGQRRTSSAVARTRQPRRLTTKEDANFQCHIKGCGKLFGRSYNYKAHMETHDSTREYPFPCPMKECNKKFVRKTDLQRHHQSVHMKQRNYRCDYCSRHFARKDTLRR